MKAYHMKADKEGYSLIRGHMGIRVDDADWEDVRQYTWYPLRQGKRVYAQRQTNGHDAGVSPSITLHRHIMGCGAGVLVHHDNEDGLDCQRANMIAMPTGKHAAYHRESRRIAALRRWGNTA